jgi:hypothetical protein
MKKTWLATAIVAWTLAGCDGEVVEDDTTHGANGSGTNVGGANAGGANAGGAGAAVGSGGATTGAGGSQAAPDPALDGPFEVVELDGSATVPATGNTVAIHAAFPADASGAPYPAVVFGHGFQLPPSQYYGYLRRLASFGYVAMTVDFEAGFFDPNHVAAAAELAHGLDWASAHPALSAIVDVENAGASGHSLGGKLALLAATMDDRIAAVIALDPVDGAMSCDPKNCPDVSDMMPIPIPTGFIGETTDASGGFQPCAPAADNFQTFYAKTAPPSLSVEVLGANHMSFLDDLAGCGFTCSFCNAATTPQDAVLGLSRAYLVAFFERHLRGDARYDDFLTGPEAQARYVDTGLAVIDAK